MGGRDQVAADGTTGAHARVRRPVCLLRGHGLATAGGSLAAAVLAAIDVHVLARLTVTCWQMGRPLTEVDPDDYRDLPVFGEDYYEQVWQS